MDTYDTTTRARAQRALENQLIENLVRSVGNSNSIDETWDFYDIAWNSLQDLAEFSANDNVERLQNYIAMVCIARVTQLYTPQEFSQTVTNVIADRPGILLQLRAELTAAMVSPARTANIVWLRFLLKLIENGITTQADVVSAAAAASVIMYNNGEEAMFGRTCWKGYTKVGMKNKSGRRVPNCVRK